MLSPNRTFSHIYVEEDALSHPITTRLLAHFQRATIVPISRYTEIFNRPRQQWAHQKEGQKLILAIRRNNFLYEGSGYTPAFGHAHFYYNTLILNCLYDCHYCYLQGMFSSANIVIFVNNEAFQSAVTEKLDEIGSLYLALSYDTDILTFENMVQYVASWIELARKRPTLTIEIRTKSVQIAPFLEVEPIQNMVVAWSLSSEHQIASVEDKTPSLDARIAAMKRVAMRGWPVRVCFDPILYEPNWQSNYTRLIEKLFTELPADTIFDVSIGVFRMNRGYMQRLKDQRPATPLAHFPYEIEGNAVTYSSDLREAMYSFMSERLQAYLPADRISLMRLS